MLPVLILSTPNVAEITLREPLPFIKELASLERFGGTASPAVSATAAPTFYRNAEVARQEVGLTVATLKSFLF